MTALMNTDVGFLQINGDLICLIVPFLHYKSMSCISRLLLSALCFPLHTPSHSKETIVRSPSRTVGEPLQPPSIGVLKTRLDKALSNLISWLILL